MQNSYNGMILLVLCMYTHIVTVYTHNFDFSAYRWFRLINNNIILNFCRHIIDWLRKKGSTKDYSVKSMQFCKLADMKIRLGMPYVLIHQGNCEHVFQFLDIR
mgnify:CR=1 FL=1